MLTDADRARIDAEGGRFNRASMYATVESIVRERLAQAWDAGYETGHLDGYLGRPDEREKNPHGALLDGGE